jgi:hypothetical protein
MDQMGAKEEWAWREGRIRYWKGQVLFRKDRNGGDQVGGKKEPEEESDWGERIRMWERMHQVGGKQDHVKRKEGWMRL